MPGKARYEGGRYQVNDKSGSVGEMEYRVVSTCRSSGMEWNESDRRLSGIWLPYLALQGLLRHRHTAELWVGKAGDVHRKMVEENLIIKGKGKNIGEMEC